MDSVQNLRQTYCTTGSLESFKTNSHLQSWTHIHRLLTVETWVNVNKACFCILYFTSPHSHINLFSASWMSSQSDPLNYITYVYCVSRLQSL
jgi:hypothetical protein